MRFLRAQFLHRLHAPGLIRPFQYEDPTTGQRVSVRTSPYYTILHVDGTDFRFNRESGRFDRTGRMAANCCGDPDLAVTRCRAAYIQRSKSSLDPSAPAPRP